MIKSFINHIRRWNIWRKRNLNGRFYKFLVLVGVTKSPTMVLTLLPEECERLDPFKKFRNEEDNGR